MCLRFGIMSTSKNIKKSERPVDALAKNGKSLTHPLTAWNQEMLAHLKTTMTKKMTLQKKFFASLNLQELSKLTS